MRAKCSNQDGNFYNFDEIGFIIGIIGARMVVMYLNRINKLKTIQPGNRERITAIYAPVVYRHAVLPFLYVTGRFHLAA
jgi:hypothetical protein